MPPFEIQVFAPFRITSSPLTCAVQLSDAASDPASGSDSANAAIASPRATAVR